MNTKTTSSSSCDRKAAINIKRMSRSIEPRSNPSVRCVRVCSNARVRNHFYERKESKRLDRCVSFAKWKSSNGKTIAIKRRNDHGEYANDDDYSSRDDDFSDDDDDDESDRVKARNGTGFSQRMRENVNERSGYRRQRTKGDDSANTTSNKDQREEIIAALIDGGEVFFLTSAVAMKARQVYVQQQNARGSTKTSLQNTTTIANNAFADVPLLVAVVVGAIMRRASGNAATGFMQGVIGRGKVKYPKAVNARVSNLEVGFEQLSENQRRYSRDVSRLGTRVRLTRRELSPMVRRAEATSVQFGEVAAELARRIEVAEDDGWKLAETMASLHKVQAKQFEVLSKSVRDIRVAMKELLLEKDANKSRVRYSDAKYAKKEELQKLEAMLTVALEEMEDCLSTMLGEKANKLEEEIKDISKLGKEPTAPTSTKDDNEHQELLVWVGESPSLSRTTKSDASSANAVAVANSTDPQIQLYKFDKVDDA